MYQSTNYSGTNNPAVNALNQYTQALGLSLSYDTNGNLSSDGTRTFTHDAANRLLSETSSGVAFTYDPLDRRESKSAGGSSLTYIYDGEDVIAEYDGQGQLARKFIHDPGIDSPILIDTGAEQYYYHTNDLGSVVALTDSTAAVAETYRYTAYGQPETPSALGNPYLYTARRYDTETGLYYYRARYYDPELRRFIQSDPIGYMGGMNLYAYVFNNPILFVDPFGLENLFTRTGPTRWVSQHIEKGESFNNVIELLKVHYGKHWTKHAWVVDLLKNLQKQWNDFGVTTCPRQEVMHYLPKQHAEFFKAAGIEIEDYTGCVYKGPHRLKAEKGMHTNQPEYDWENWNKQWTIFRRKNPQAGVEEIERQLRKMMFEHALMSAKD